jgi:hypothetical protein
LKAAYPDGERTLLDSARQLEERGLALIGLIDSSRDDWDHYESLHYRAIENWARANPVHLERRAVLERNERAKRQYLEFEREFLGWAIFVCRLA